MFIGFSVLGLGVLGLLSLLGGDPAPTDGYDASRTPAGSIGALVAHPLANVISPIGAAIVCLGFAMLGALIFTGTPIATVWAKLRDFFTAADVSEEPATPREPDEEPSRSGSTPPRRSPPPRRSACATSRRRSGSRSPRTTRS